MRAEIWWEAAALLLAYCDRYLLIVIPGALMASAGGSMPPLLLIHPIGVGLSSRFWDRFTQRWLSDHPHLRAT